ncbi:MAG: hypothetical protein JST54_30290 [Deltaproteobacteria bacterium]|nr:hypothetical protein [Deltaproteobacteria bacterium]
MADTFRLHELGSLVLLDWLATPTVPALDEIGQKLDAAIARGKPLALITVIRDGTVAPDSKVRDHMNTIFKPRLMQLRAHCLVIEGKGLAADAKRLFTRAALALIGQGAPIFDSLQSALRSPAFAPEAALEAQALALRAG